MIMFFFYVNVLFMLVDFMMPPGEGVEMTRMRTSVLPPQEEYHHLN